MRAAARPRRLRRSRSATGRRCAPERVRVRTVAEDQANLNDALGRLTGYLGLVALIALLLGGIGVASAVVVFIRQRLDTIAVLRCLGATAGRVLAVYAAEAAAMGLAGSVAGAALGVLAAAAPAGAARRTCCRWTSRPAISSRAPWRSASGMGLWVALIFALLPLLGVRRIRRSRRCAATLSPSRGAGAIPWRLAARRGAGGERGRAGRRSRWGAGVRGRSSPAAIAVGAAGALGCVLAAHPRGAPLASGAAGPMSGGRASPTCTDPRIRR